MGSSMERVLVSTSENAKAALQGARGNALLDSRPSAIRLGLVTAAADGIYTVGVVGANGAIADSIPGIRVWGDATYSIGDRVLLLYIGDRPIPFIASGSGGGDATFQTAITGFLGFVSE